jgi:hypothetical protein
VACFESASVAKTRPQLHRTPGSLPCRQVQRRHHHSCHRHLFQVAPVPAQEFCCCEGSARSERLAHPPLRFQDDRTMEMGRSTLVANPLEEFRETNTPPLAGVPSGLSRLLSRGQPCSELYFALTGARQCKFLSHRRNRDGISTHKLQVRVFTEPGPKADSPRQTPALRGPGLRGINLKVAADGDEIRGGRLREWVDHVRASINF